MTGWMSSDLDASGERHAFRLELTGPLENPYTPNCPDGYRAYCGKIAKTMKLHMVGEPSLQDWLWLPKCEACETLYQEEAPL